MQVALNGAPLLHTRMSLQERCETALTGFVAMDLFRMVSDRLCHERKLPKGSLFMANQTSSTLQLAALSAAVICLTKDPTWDGFRVGHGRLTELSIEQHFGCIRQQSQNSQHSCRSYFLASARQTLRMHKILSKQSAPNRTEPKLTPEELLGFQMFAVVGHQGWG